MKTGHNQLLPPLFVFILCLCIYLSQQQIEPQLCKQCRGSSLNGSAVGKFCFSSNGRITGRCCLANETSYHERIIGLDLSNCSLTHVGNLQEASTTLMIDLSSNSIVNISDTAFEGFRQLSQLILPADVACPGGNSSWDKVAIENGTRLCEGQRNMCIQTGKMSVNCPEYSQCAPYGPGYFECSCADNYHGYKCLREGEFPSLQVFGPLGASTLALSLLLWLTQRRKAKSL
ncbi:all-trans retinoic acid-induced differentiation factor [Syngnathus scovelli]|uniref:all-trans retinoic acid-induced differentiation factor n=1 Tax=Syngnathus scovelli TaxID=161590 RepID=UPI0021107A10|nr:all-trans retinoic acid-induced differentiation factor [Syngnathus scovelli]